MPLALDKQHGHHPCPGDWNVNGKGSLANTATPWLSFTFPPHPSVLHPTSPNSIAKPTASGQGSAFPHSTGGPEHCGLPAIRHSSSSDYNSQQALRGAALPPPLRADWLSPQRGFVPFPIGSESCQSRGGRPPGEQAGGRILKRELRHLRGVGLAADERGVVAQLAWRMRRAERGERRRGVLLSPGQLRG